MIPAFNEAESIGPLVAKVDRGPRRGLGTELRDPRRRRRLAATAPPTRSRADRRACPALRLIALRAQLREVGRPRHGIPRVPRVDFVVTIDADLQDDPEEIPAFSPISRAEYDLVSGWKRQRHDPWTKTLPEPVLQPRHRAGSPGSGSTTSTAASRPTGARSSTRSPSTARCTATSRSSRSRRGLEGRRAGGAPPCRGATAAASSAPSRFVNGFLDLLLVMFLSGRHRSPLHVFGRLGVLFLTVGLGLINLYMAGIWIVEARLRVRPLLLFGVILVILGVQFISIGLLAEMIAGRPHASAGAPGPPKRLPEGGGLHAGLDHRRGRVHRFAPVRSPARRRGWR